jgi:CubicO group peptidase (beta-lactamase class C family)
LRSGAAKKRDRYRPWLWALLTILLLQAACSNRSTPPTIPPTASQTEISTAAQTPTPSTVWPAAGWDYSTPEEQGLDSAVLEQLGQGIRADVPAARSLLVVRNGSLVYEEYFKDDESYAGPVYSVTKSIISALIGIALEEGLIGDFDDVMLDYLGQFDTEEVDPSLKAITIEHLLTMTAGFEFEPMGAFSVPASLREELVSEPGEMAAYNSTSTHLLSAVVSEAAGMSALNMANDRIFSRLGIPRPIWSGDGFGVSIGGYGLNLTPRDMAKFGYLYLNEGLWDG